MLGKKLNLEQHIIKELPSILSKVSIFGFEDYRDGKIGLETLINMSLGFVR